MTRTSTLFSVSTVTALLVVLLWPTPGLAQLQAEFGIMGGFATAPFDYDDGWYYAGFIDLPLKAHENVGVFQGEVLVGLAASDDNRETLTTALLGKQAVQTDQRELEILFGLKYRFDVTARLKPYLIGGPGVVVNLNNPKPLVAGQVPVPPELQERGIPTGQGNFLAAGHIGGGIVFLLTDLVSIGVDGRFIVQENSNSNYGTVGGRVAFHF